MKPVEWNKVYLHIRNEDHDELNNCFRGKVAPADADNKAELNKGKEEEGSNSETGHGYSDSPEDKSGQERILFPKTAGQIRAEILQKDLAKSVPRQLLPKKDRVITPSRRHIATEPSQEK